MSRLLFIILIAWAATTAPTSAQPTLEPDSPSAPTPKPSETGPAPTRHTTGEGSSKDDEELIKNLDLIENLDLLDTVDVLGAVNTPDTPEEEF